jgi:hypothetical protein
LCGRHFLSTPRSRLIHAAARAREAGACAGPRRTAPAHSAQLQYARGAPLPLHLTLASADAQALDLLSAPGAPVVKLLASLSTRPGKEALRELKARKELRDRVVLALRAGAEYQVESRGAGRAAWWPAPGAASGSGERRLFGEIHLDRALAPPMDTPDVALTVRTLR